MKKTLIILGIVVVIGLLVFFLRKKKNISSESADDIDASANPLAAVNPLAVVNPPAAANQPTAVDPLAAKEEEIQKQETLDSIQKDIDDAIKKQQIPDRELLIELVEEQNDGNGLSDKDIEARAIAEQIKYAMQPFISSPSKYDFWKKFNGKMIGDPSLAFNAVSLFQSKYGNGKKLYERLSVPPAYANEKPVKDAIKNLKKEDI